MSVIKIYTLTDPRNNQIIYVGASKCSDAAILYRHKHKKGVRKELAGLKIEPVLETLEVAYSVKDAARLEEYWYYQLISWGFRLDNHRWHSPYCEKPGKFGKRNLNAGCRLTKKAIGLITQGTIEKLAATYNKSESLIETWIELNRGCGKLTYPQGVEILQAETGLPYSELVYWE